MVPTMPSAFWIYTLQRTCVRLFLARSIHICSNYDCINCDDFKTSNNLAAVRYSYVNTCAIRLVFKSKPRNTYYFNHCLRNYLYDAQFENFNAKQFNF